MDNSRFTLEEERAILANPTIQSLVNEVMEIASRRDPLDALRDIELVAMILRSRFERQLESDAAADERAEHVFDDS